MNYTHDPKPEPVPDDTPLEDFHLPRFIKVGDFLNRWKVRERVFRIARVAKEPTTPNPRDLDPDTADDKNPNGKPRVIMQYVLYFIGAGGAEYPRGYLVSTKADTESLKSATNANTAGELIGKRIRIHVTQHRKQDVLRIDPNPPQEKPAPAA